RLRAAEHRGEGLQRDAHDVVVRLLRGERDARGLRMGAELQRALVRRLVAPLDLARPDAPRRAELRDLLEEVVVHVEEEGHAGYELVHIKTGGYAPLHVLEPVDERERELLERRRARLADVIAGHADGVPLRHLTGAEAERVDDEI